MHIVIFVTTSSKKEAQNIAIQLLEKKLAACVNILGGLDSRFWWKGNIDSAKEVLLIIKSKRVKLPKIIKLIKSLHSYEVPEIIALPVTAGEKDYLRWIDASCR